MVSPRQESILALLEQGMSVDEVANELDLSPNTVLSQITRIRARWGLTCPTRELPAAVDAREGRRKVAT